MYKLGLEKAEEPGIKLLTSTESQRKEGNSKKTCFMDCVKASDCVDHNKLWKTVTEMVIPDHLICLPRNL